MSKRIVIMAGGTGGHVFPALAVAQYLREQGWQVSWLGTQNGLEARVVPAANIEIDWLSVAGFRGKGLFFKLGAIFKLTKACLQARRILKQRKPNVVLGMGGFVAGPGGLMAKSLSIPLIIHEQNRVPGTTNRWLARLAAKKVVQAFDGSFAPAARAQTVGNPVRSDFCKLPERVVWQAGQRPLRILIVGGSQGAQALNLAVPEGLAGLGEVEIKHQTGTAMQADVSQHYAKLGLNAEAVAFIEDMAAAYQWADLLICRAGAMTISEITASALPAILVPLPHAIDDHQTANAKVLSESGAAILLPQSQLSPDVLRTTVQQIMNQLPNMSSAAKRLARLDATQVVANICQNEAKS